MKVYKIIEASSPYELHLFEEFEAKINRAAMDGYSLKEKSIQVIREDRGPNEMTICRAIAVMTKEKKPEKIQC